MEEALAREFVDYSVKKLEQLAGRIETCLGKLSEEQVWARGSTNENAIGNLVLHLCGNVRQWIVSGVGDSPDIRHRDQEFAATGGVAIVELIGRLQATVRDAADALRSVTAERLNARIVVQKYNVSVLEAIYHVVEHFSMHTGQILFATKMLTGADLGFYAHLRAAAAHGQTKP